MVSGKTGTQIFLSLFGFVMKKLNKKRSNEGDSAVQIARYGMGPNYASMRSER